MNKQSIGVIIGRFQIDSLHNGHKALIRKVCDKHPEIVILVGCTDAKGTRRNPLDFSNRKKLLEDVFDQYGYCSYHSHTILPVQDAKTNEVWSKNVDNVLDLVFPNINKILYGSRDSFIDSYHGKYKTELIKLSCNDSATARRAELSTIVDNYESFRRGIIYSTYNSWPVSQPTIDAIIHDGEGNILLARKKDEEEYRLVGGFVDVKDASYEDALQREVKEEANLDVSEINYIASSIVNDWRYERDEDRSVISSFYTCLGKITQAKAGDDINEVVTIPFEQYKSVLMVPTHKRILTENFDKIKSLIN